MYLWLMYVEIAKHWPVPCGHALLREMNLGQDQEAIGNIQYNFHFIYFPWKWGTIAPEAHGAQVLPDPNLGSKQVTHTHLVGCALQLLCYKVSSKMHGWDSRTTLGPILSPLFYSLNFTVFFKKKNYFKIWQINALKRLEVFWNFFIYRS